jgi:type IV secretory pathway ATPase VirB11/archaellum biosynthesis ATPase
LVEGPLLGSHDREYLKTTLFNAVGKFIADQDSILLIEDTPERACEKAGFGVFIP